MSDDNWGFAPPPFNPEQALLQLERSLRDLKLSARGNAFELKGRRVIELERGDAAIEVRLARRLVQATPEWDRFTLEQASDSRKLLDELKKRLERWRDDD